MEKKEALIFSVLAILLVVFSGFLYFNQGSNYITGNAVLGGHSDDLGDKEESNPDKGVIKGTITYTIKDGETIINREYAENATLYFVREQNVITEFSKVKASSKQYKHNLVTIDVDSSNSRCSQKDYTTILSYYDENSNSQEEGNEFEVYKIMTDENGCYAAKVKGGDYSIYL